MTNSKPTEHQKHRLPAGTKLSHYELLSVLGGGGFSIVYLAHDLETDQEVVVKEYFPQKMATRNEQGDIVPLAPEKEKLFKLGRKLFFQEAGILASIEHPNITRILNFFRANGTVYTAMEYHKGNSLQSIIKQNKGQMPEEDIMQLLPGIIDGLEAMHTADLLHLDIKPGNIYIKENAEPILIDFGAVHKILRIQSVRMFPVVSHGFSPIEQSNKKAKLGPYSDIYAVGATIRACIEGKPPVSAKDRYKKVRDLIPAKEAFAGKYSEKLLDTIDHCMALMPRERPTDLQALREMLFPKAS